MLGSRVRKDIKKIRKNNDLNYGCVRHTNNTLTNMLLVYLLIWIVLSSILFVVMESPEDFTDYLVRILFMFPLCFILFLSNISYEKKSIICHSHGKITPAKAIGFTRGLYGKPIIMCEYFVDGKRKGANCPASSSMENNYEKGQQLFILYVGPGSPVWILEETNIPILTLSKTRRDYLLETL